MTSQYIGELKLLGQQEKAEWADYILSFQDPETGFFLGPEIMEGSAGSASHSRHHVSEHLTAHVLPALSLLGAQPRFPLAFAQDYADLKYLQDWLALRNWEEAWLEGNNLLFVGQFLTELMESGKNPAAREAFDLLSPK